MKRFSTAFVLLLAITLCSMQLFAKGGDADVSGPFVAQSAIHLSMAKPADITGQWSPVKDLPQGMGYNTAEFYNGALYNFSGLNSATITQCYKLDIASDTWSTTVTLPQARLLAGSHLVGDKIYIVGGYSSGNPFTTHGQVLEFDPAANTITPKSAMNTPAYGFGSFEKDGRIWVLGGGTTSFQAQTDAIQIYDPATDRWATSNSRLPLAMRAFGVAEINGEVYLVGGYQYTGSQGVFFAHFYKGTIAGDEITWTKLADFPGGSIMRQSMGTDGSKVYLTSGMNAATQQTGIPSKTTWSYDPATSTWTSEAMKITPVYYGSRMVYDGAGKFYVAGGVGSQVYEAKVEVYDAAAASSPIAVISGTGIDRWVKRANSYKFVFGLGNIGGADLEWSSSVAAGASWLTIDAPDAGTVQPGQQAAVIFTVNPTSLTPGKYNADITVTTNDPAHPSFTYAVAITVQEEDVDEPANVLIEQYTGTWCQWCPYGADSLAAVSARYGSRVVRTSWHDSDPMEIATWDAMNNWIGVTGFPTASINRITWPGSSSIPISRTDWGARAGYVVNNLRAPVGITISDKSYDPANKTYSFKATVFFHQGIDADVRLNAVVTEDGFDYAQKRTNLATGVVETISPYIHKAVVMGIWPDHRGYQLSLGNTFASQASIEQVFTFTSPHVNPDNAILNVYVHTLNNGNPGPVLQAVNEPLFFGVTDVDEVPTASAFGLRQNYPNPFNPTTNITYDVPSRSHVRITLHDALGRSLGNLVDETSEAGSHTFTFDGANLQSGTYYLTMTAGDFVQTRSMTLVK